MIDKAYKTHINVTFNNNKITNNESLCKKKHPLCDLTDIGMFQLLRLLILKQCLLRYKSMQLKYLLLVI